jgi:8-oxo-dGTP pyrophosphatase MutT (NUDIX family)
VTFGAFRSSTGTVTFTEGGSLTQPVTIVINGDTTPERNERLFVNLSNIVSTVGNAVISDAQGIGTILTDDPAAPLHIRPSVRGIIIRDGKILMVHSRKFDYYKFPGGGLEPGESHEAALCREVWEESGFTVVPGSVREYGLVPRRERDDDGTTFVQDNFYYLCEIDRAVGQDLDEYEAEEGFTPEFVDPRHAIETNLHHDHSGKESAMFPREAGVLKWLLDEGYFD